MTEFPPRREDTPAKIDTPTRTKLKRLALRWQQAAYNEGVKEAGVGDGPGLDRKRRATAKARDAYLAYLAERS